MDHLRYKVIVNTVFVFTQTLTPRYNLDYIRRPSEKVKPSDIFEEKTVCYVHFKGLNSDNLKSAG